MSQVTGLYTPESMAARRAAQRARDAEPASLVERLYHIAEKLKAADRAVEDFYAYELTLMTPERAAQFEAIFPDKPPYFEIDPIRRQVEEMADGWAGELDHTPEDAA